MYDCCDHFFCILYRHQLSNLLSRICEGTDHSTTFTGKKKRKQIIVVSYSAQNKIPDIYSFFFYIFFC